MALMRNAFFMAVWQQTLEQLGLPGSLDPTHWIITTWFMVLILSGSSSIKASNSSWVVILSWLPRPYSSGRFGKAPVAKMVTP